MQCVGQDGWATEKYTNVCPRKERVKFKQCVGTWNLSNKEKTLHMRVREEKLGRDCPNVRPLITKMFLACKRICFCSDRAPF